MKMEKKIQTESAEETQRLAYRLAQSVQGGDVLTLSGDLGAGKTCFTQGFAQGLGITRQVNSPTFTIIKEYQGRELSLYHMDAYRLDDENEELGLTDYFYGEGVTVVEWPQMIMSQLPEKRLDITISYHPVEENRRMIQLAAKGERYQNLLKEVFA